VRIIRTTIVPPTNSINDVFWVRAEVAIKLITKLGGTRGSERGHVVKDVIAF
jgi:hypothetical protein